jgi:demethylmenaquinone methyltransferase/2-methoxy-6-polyprenyl-1,4-benzoquinol methylase
MFDRIAPRYDLLNRLLSAGRDVAWRKRVTTLLPRRKNMAVLDLATGTADLLMALYDHGRNVTFGVGMDMAGKMLRIARRKIDARNLNGKLSVVQGDATSLPFPNSSFDAVTIAFGIRNLVDVNRGLREMNRILNVGGKAMILEFSLPKNRFRRRGDLLYFRYILPVVGGIISGDSYAYRYLNRTVETFPYGDEFCRMMQEAGFEDVSAHSLTFGIATIYEGSRRERSQQ